MFLKKKTDYWLWNDKHPSDTIFDVKTHATSGIADAFDEEIQEQPMNEYGLKMDYVDKCLDTIFNWSLDDGWFLYARIRWEDGWSRRFDAVEQSPLYKKNITEKEKALYTNEKFIREMWPYFFKSSTKNIIELWSWSGEKFPEYRHKAFQYHDSNRPINTYHLQKDQKKYYAIDISPQSIDDTGKNYERGGIKLSNGVVGDFFEWGELPRNIDDQWFAFIGGSIGNFQPQKIQKLFERMLPNSRFHSVPALITYFSAPDKKKLIPQEYQNKILELLATYGDPDFANPYYDEQTHQAIHDFIMGWFQALWLPVEKLKLKVEYVESKYPWSPASIKVWAQIMEDFSVKTQHRTYHGSKWHTLRAIQSQRFSPEDRKGILGKTWFSMKTNFNNEGVSAMLLQSKIGYRTTFKKEKNTLMTLALLSALTAWSLMARNSFSDKMIREEVENVGKEDLKDKKMTVSTYDNVDELSPEQIEIWMNKTAEEVFNSIQIRYCVWDIKNKIGLINEIKDHLSQNLSLFGYSWYHNVNVIEYTDLYIKEHKRSFKLKGEWMNTIPYQNMKVPDENFKNVINCTGKEKSFNQNKIILPWWFEHWVDVSWHKKYIGKYQTKFWDIYDLWMFNKVTNISVPPSIDMSWLVSDEYENFMFAAPYNEDDENKENKEYSYLLKYAQIVAYDYFEQSRPVTSEIINYFYKLFMWSPSTYYLGSKHWEYYKYNTLDYGYEFDVGHTPRELIIKDLVNTWMIYRIKPWDYDGILEYLASFYVRYKATRKSSKVEYIRPYENLYPYTQAFQNTIWSEKLDLTLVSQQEREKYKFKYLWTYTMINQKKYDIAVVEIDHKQYIAAREDGKADIRYQNQETIYNNDYYLWFHGQDVAKDYLKIIRKFWDAPHFAPPHQAYSGKNDSAKFQNIKPDSKSKGFTFYRPKKP